MAAAYGMSEWMQDFVIYQLRTPRQDLAEMPLVSLRDTTGQHSRQKQRTHHMVETVCVEVKVQVVVGSRNVELTNVHKFTFPDHISRALQRQRSGYPGQPQRWTTS